MKITERDIEVLDELRAAVENHVRVGLPEWVTPMHCGGSNGSDHSYRLTKLSRAGLAEQKKRGGGWQRGSKVYRITEAGMEVLKEGKAHE